MATMNALTQAYRATCIPQMEDRIADIIPNEYIGRELEIIVLPVFENVQPEYNAGNIPAISEYIAKEIDSEIDALEMDNNKQIKDSFIASAKQLKGLLTNEAIKKTPDVVMFNKGYVGLVWETKDDESIFVYSIPDGTLFFNRVGVKFSETRIIDADRKLFSDLIKQINAMV